MPDAGTARVWLERAETLRAKLWLLGCVVPRAVASSRAAAHRSEESGIPSWQVGAREFGETATDELFIAISALYRATPHEHEIEESVRACAEVADELVGLGVAGAHRAPPPVAVLGLRRRKAMGTTYEHLELESRPRLPAGLARAGYAELEVAHTRVLRHGPRDERPWVVFVHGAEQGRTDDFHAFRAGHLHRDLGLNVAMPVLPHHGPRRALGRSWPGFDLVDNVATMMRAVSDVRSTIDWIHQQHPGASVSVVGMSLGGPVAALTAGLDDRVDGVCAMVPMLDAAGTIAHHVAKTGGRGRRLADLLRSEPVRAVGSVVDPLALEPHAPASRRLVVAALGDRMTSVQAAQRLHDRWGGEVVWHHGGHIGHLLSGTVRAALDDFLTASPEPVSR